MIKKLTIFIFTGLALIIYSCQDPWDSRFSTETPGQNVWQIVSGTPQYSKFAGLMQQTGYDSVLQRSTVFTAFVIPDTYFPDISQYSSDDKSLLASYLLSNYVIYSDGMVDKASIKSLNGKYLAFSVSGNSVLVNDKAEVIKSNILASNGVIHEINSSVEPKSNILDFINSNPDYSYLADFFAEGTTLIFDKDHSTAIGINDDGQTVYDSVWKQSNDFLSTVADLSSEDEEYTMFLATDMMLDTSANGNNKIGYLSNIGSFIVKGLIDKSEFPGDFTSVTGFNLTLGTNNTVFLDKLSNGWAYSIVDFQGIRIPKTIQWEITDIADFDSIRQIKTVDYTSIYNLLTGIKVTEMSSGGGFTSFKYVYGGLGNTALNKDYLSIITIKGTLVKLTITVPDLIPGKYAVKMRSQLQVADGLYFDVYVNSEKIGSQILLSSTEIAWADITLGNYVFTSETGNTLTISVLGSKPSNVKGNIDYFIFEPVK